MILRFRETKISIKSDFCVELSGWDNVVGKGDLMFPVSGGD
jgi:hypothetical protein